MVCLEDFIIGVIFGLIGLIFDIKIGICFFIFATGYSIIRRPMLEKRDALVSGDEQ